MNDRKFLIHKFSHFFVVYLKDFRFTNLVYEFTHRYVDYKPEFDPKTKQTREVPRVWGGRLGDNSAFRFPIGALQEFEHFLSCKGVYKHELDYMVEPLYPVAFADFKVDDIYKARDYQEEAMTYTETNRLAGCPSVLISMPPGTGKTFTLAKIFERLKQRASMIIAPNYMDKWADDAKQYLNLTDERVYMVRGGKSIRQAVEMINADEFDKDLTIISLVTFAEFMKEYESSPRQAIDSYGTDPISLWSQMKIGVMGGDEVHERFHAMYWFNTFLHVPFHVGLSATMLNSDPFVERMQKVIYPSHIRFDKIKMKKYINLYNVDYDFENLERDRIKTSFPRNKNYNQTAFENSILKNKKVLANWLGMVRWAIETFFFHSTNQPDDKLGLYFGRVEMINTVLEYLKAEYPTIDIRRYVGGTKYADLMEPVIRVTNIGSAGTGKDIKGLTTVLNFDVKQSRVTNNQLYGRIREIVGRDDLLFVQFNCRQFKKHQKYKIDRNAELAPKARTMSQRYYPTAL